MPLTPAPRRRNGKIACLPNTIRDQINLSLHDGLTYAQVLKKLGPDADGINRDNLRNWHRGGYKDWLRDQVWLEQMHTKLQFAREVLQAPDGSNMREASLTIAVKQMFDFLARFDPLDFTDKVSQEPASYARILNSLSKLAEIGLKYDRQRAEQAGGNSSLHKNAAKTNGLTDQTLVRIEDDFHLFPREREVNGGQRGSTGPNGA